MCWGVSGRSRSHPPQRPTRKSSHSETGPCRVVNTPNQNHQRRVFSKLFSVLFSLAFTHPTHRPSEGSQPYILLSTRFRLPHAQSSSSRGPEFERVLFSLDGQSPLVSHYLRMRQLRARDAHVGRKVKRTEIVSDKYPCTPQCSKA